MTLHDIAEYIAASDGRSVEYIYHVAIYAARSLGIYAPRAVYDYDTSKKIRGQIFLMLP